MSKRGSGSSARAGGGANEAKSLDSTLVRRSNDFSLFDAGDATKREYEANVKKIQQSNLTQQEKSAALDKLHELTTEQLKAQTKVANPYVSGPARFNQNQVQKAADNTAETAKRQFFYERCAEKVNRKQKGS